MTTHKDYTEYKQEESNHPRSGILNEEQHSEIDRQIAEFKANGGKIQQIEAGVSGIIPEGQRTEKYNREQISNNLYSAKHKEKRNKQKDALGRDKGPWHEQAALTAKEKGLNVK